MLKIKIISQFINNKCFKNKVFIDKNKFNFNYKNNI